MRTDFRSATSDLRAETPGDTDNTIDDFIEYGVNATFGGGEGKTCGVWRRVASLDCQSMSLSAWQVV